MQYYKSQFESAGFLKQISSFSPDGHSSTDSKEDKLLKYAKQYDVALSDIYYYDDGKGNIDRAINAGIKNSFEVTKQAPLENQLNQLLVKVVSSPESIHALAALSYQKLKNKSIDLASEISQRTRVQRYKLLDHPDTESYWNNMSPDERVTLLQQDNYSELLSSLETKFKNQNFIA